MIGIPPTRCVPRGHGNVAWRSDNTVVQHVSSQLQLSGYPLLLLASAALAWEATPGRSPLVGSIPKPKSMVLATRQAKRSRARKVGATTDALSERHADALRDDKGDTLPREGAASHPARGGSASVFRFGRTV